MLSTRMNRGHYITSSVVTAGECHVVIRGRRWEEDSVGESVPALPGERGLALGERGVASRVDHRQTLSTAASAERRRHPRRKRRGCQARHPPRTGPASSRTGRIISSAYLCRGQSAVWHSDGVWGRGRRLGFSPRPVSPHPEAPPPRLETKASASTACGLVERRPNGVGRLGRDSVIANGARQPPRSPRGP